MDLFFKIPKQKKKIISGGGYSDDEFIDESYCSGKRNQKQSCKKKKYKNKEGNFLLAKKKY